MRAQEWQQGAPARFVQQTSSFVSAHHISTAAACPQLILSALPFTFWRAGWQRGYSSQDTSQEAGRGICAGGAGAKAGIYFRHSVKYLCASEIMSNGSRLHGVEVMDFHAQVLFQLAAFLSREIRSALATVRSFALLSGNQW